MLTIYLSLLDTPEDKDKLRAIYEKYHDLMMGVAFKVLGNEHDAQDAVHQAFLTLIKNLEKISRVDCLETRRFCVIITRSRCLDMLRLRKRAFSTGSRMCSHKKTGPAGDGRLPPIFREEKGRKRTWHG